MKYELAKRLKEAGFPQKGFGEGGFTIHETKGTFCNCVMCEEEGQAGGYSFDSLEEMGHVYAPTLSELIEACGDDFWKLEKVFSGWVAYPKPEPDDSLVVNKLGAFVSTPEEAVSKLWLNLNK